MPPPDGSHSTHWNRVSPGYFETVGMPIIAGRGILDSDRDNTPGVAVVNESFAKKFFGNQSALGRHFRLALPDYANALEIVGVVRDAKSGDLRKPVQPMAFGALTQHINYSETILQGSDKWDHFINSVQILHSGNAGALDSQIREAFRQADPNFAILSIQPVSEEVDTQLDQQHAVAELSGLFGVLALVLASIGLYGVTAYTVAQRTGEIGIRMALGADRLHIVLLVLRGAFMQVALGVAIGLPAALLVSRLLSAMLYHVGIFDPASLGAAIAALLLGACVASVLPAYRAASTDPVRSLRAE